MRIQKSRIRVDGASCLEISKFRFITLRNFADIITIEAQKIGRSETKVRILIAEIRVISLISANFACISFAQYCQELLNHITICAKLYIYNLVTTPKSMTNVSRENSILRFQPLRYVCKYRYKNGSSTKPTLKT